MAHQLGGSFWAEAPLLLEIGFGGGDFLVDLAQRHPEANVVGLEISWPSLKRAEDKVSRRRLSNVRLVAGGAFRFLWATCLPAAVDAVFINFPDPWPKLGHHARRLIQDDFLALLATRVREGGTLDVATDHADYAAWIDEHLRRSRHFESRLPTFYVNEDPIRLQTKYERKGLEEGRRCAYFKYRRNDRPVLEPYPIPQELAMPHFIIHHPLPLTAIRDRFAEQQREVSGISIRFIRLYEDVGDEALLFETHVVEPELVQRVGLALRARSDGDLICHLHDFGFPRPTRGMHAALKCFGDWLLSLAPDAAIRNTNLAFPFEAPTELSAPPTSPESPVTPT